MTAIATTTSTTSRAKYITLWTLQILLAAFFIIASGMPKLIGESHAVATFEDIGWGDWFRYFTGLVEVSGGIGLLIPRLTRLAAAGLSITTVCAALTQIFLLHAPALAPFPLVLAVVFGWIAYSRR